MMKRILSWQGALLAAAIGVISTGNLSSVAAAQFDQTEISDQNRLIVIAAPLGTKGGNHRLLILEQLNDRRLCWQESGSSPTLVDPLLVEFDFTGICGRGTDSNSYSVRVQGQDLAGRYNLRIVRKSNDLVLVAYSLVDKEIQSFEIGRTNGLTESFAKINLDPGWRLARRSFQGKNVGHIYLIHDQSLAEVANKAIPLQPTVPLQPSITAPTPSPAGMPVQPSSVESAPSRPQPSSYPVSVPPMPQVDPTLPNPQMIPLAQPAPANPVAQPNTSGAIAPSPTQNFVVPTVAPENPASPSFNPAPSAPTGLPPQSFVPINSSSLFNLSYRVVVDAATPERQAQVKQLMPSAFRTFFDGQQVMQVGVFRDRATAESLQQQLNLQNLQARIISNRATATSPILPTPLIASASINTPLLAAGTKQIAFNLPEPNSASALQNLSIWATYYTTHQAENQSSGYPLLDPTGNNLGVALSERDWCAAALEGSVQIANGQSILGVYNFAGRGDTDQVNCLPYYPTLKNISATNRVRFKPSNTPYGEGANGNQLVPYRTIAVDRTLIPIGSVVYIPAARGVTVTLPSGDRAVHDGYFYAGDVGSAIKGNHIDVFLGTAKQNPFPFVKSTASATFNAYIVNAPSLKAMLTSQPRLFSTVGTTTNIAQTGKN